MNTVPTVDDLLEGFIIALNNEIMPFLNNPKAVATAAMMQRCCRRSARFCRCSTGRSPRSTTR